MGFCGTVCAKSWVSAGPAGLRCTGLRVHRARTLPCPCRGATEVPHPPGPLRFCSEREGDGWDRSPQSSREPSPWGRTRSSPHPIPWGLWLLPATLPFTGSSHESLDLGHLCHHGWARDLYPVQSTGGAESQAAVQARPVGSSSFILNQELSPCSPLPGLLGGSDVPGGQEQVPRAAVAEESSRSRLPLGAVRKSRRGLTAAASQPERERERLQSRPCVGIAANNGGGRRRARRL